MVKFAIANLDGDVQLLMCDEDEGNLLMFNIVGEDKADGEILVQELSPLCDILNEQQNTIDYLQKKIAILESDREEL